MPGSTPPHLRQRTVQLAREGTTRRKSQVGVLARWASPVREALSLLTVMTAIGAMPAMIKAATIQSRARRPQAGHEPESPS